MHILGWVVEERSQSEVERKFGQRLREQGCFVQFLGPYDSLELHIKKEPQGWLSDL